MAADVNPTAARLKSAQFHTEGKAMGPGIRDAAAGSTHGPNGHLLAELLPQVAQQVGEGVAVFDMDDWVLYANPAMAKLHECEVEDLVGQHLSTFVGPVPEGHEELRDEAEAIGDGVLRVEMNSHRVNGDPLDVAVTISALRDDTGTRIGRIVCVRDITERKQLERLLERASLHDPLTDLPNRRLLADRLEQALVRASRTATSVAVLFLDLDGFKNVNDAHGHAVGDELLVQVADRLRPCLRATDTLARLGGDEFVVLLEQVTDSAETTVSAERLKQALTPPFALGKVRVRISASIGVAVSTTGAARSLLHAADSAMYRAKSAGRGLVVSSP